MKKLKIAIDGPAGAGKSTVAQIVAHRLKYTYIDTGAMYRALTWKALQLQLPLKDRSAIEKLARNLELKLYYIDGKLKVYVNNEDVTSEIRTPEVTKEVAELAQIPEVRAIMIELQRQMAQQGGAVLDGRDISTYVLPDAEVKIFLTASVEERAERRWKEMIQKGLCVNLDDVKNDIACRDQMDCEREIAPLIKAPDAVLIDTTRMSIEDAVQEILNICRERESLV